MRFFRRARSRPNLPALSRRRSSATPEALPVSRTWALRRWLLGQWLDDSGPSNRQIVVAENVRARRSWVCATQSQYAPDAPTE
jgi:hypothetical protein